jgi:ribosomal protein S18 acetylase RimI-like enzyme
MLFAQAQNGMKGRRTLDSDKILVRNVNRADLPLLVEFYNEYEPGSISFPPVRPEEAEQFFFGAPNFKSEGCFLAFSGDELVGAEFAEWDPDVLTQPCVRQGDIWWLRVKKGWQRRRIGSLLLSKALSFLKEEGMNEVVTWVLEQNQADYTFYSKHGFKVLEHIFRLERPLLNFNLIQAPSLPEGYEMQPFNLGMLSDWVALYNRAFKGTPDLPHWGSRELSVEEYRSWMLGTSDSTGCVGIKYGGRLVAICEAVIDRDMTERTGCRVGNIRTIAVDIAHRRKGLARTLVAQALVWSKKRGTEAAGATIWGSNTASLSLFKSFAFNTTRVTYVMMKRL